MKITLIVVCCLTLFFFNCSVFMAAKQPDKRDLSLFQAGTHRKLLLAEFGLPIVSEIKEDGKRYDIFIFVQGYSDGAKAGRVLFHGTADILTMGLWEVIGTPAEAVFDGDKIAYQVRYDECEVIDQVAVLKRY